jgi:hypothetical protein
MMMMMMSRSGAFSSDFRATPKRNKNKKNKSQVEAAAAAAAALCYANSVIHAICGSFRPAAGG